MTPKENNVTSPKKEREREYGYYWVQFMTEWRTAEYYNGLWYVIGRHESYSDSDFDEIGSRITPSMKYTEEDLRSYGRNCATERFESEDRFADWLKQRNTAK